MSHERLDLLNKIIAYVKITVSDIDTITSMQFQDNTELQLQSVNIYFEKYEDTSDEEKSIFRRMYIETRPVGGYSMRNFVTHRPDRLLEIYSKRADKSTPSRKTNQVLTSAEMQNLITGSKYKRRSIHDHYDTHFEDTDLESDDPDYIPDISDSDSGSENSDTELACVEESQLTNVTVASTGQSCIKRILFELKKIDNKHNWINHNVDSLLKDFLSSRKAVSKLFLYKMDIINREVHSTFSKELFKKGDPKSVQIEKISNQLKKIPQLFEYSSNDEDVVNVNPSKLQDILRTLMLSQKYPKEFLVAPICEVTHDESVIEWETKSTVPVKMFIPFLKKDHIIFNYPEFNEERNQVEMRTFDYTHILNNLHFYISNSGLEHVRSNAFIEVSKKDHDILPRAIVKLKMDRQNYAISQRFFSEEVQKILTELGHSQEAEFVKLVWMWFRACDECGMAVNDRLLHLNKMYNYLVSLLELSHYPPNRTHVAGIPIRTYEAMLHSISTRFTLFTLSSTNSYNTCAISTLAVESFFSDLTRFEFSGLGAPKSVDIPKLITHIVHINSTKHDPS